MEQIVNGADNQHKTKYTSDWTLWACYIILCIVSVVEVFSASSQELRAGSVYLPIASHVRWLLIGLVLMLGLEHIHYKYFKILMLIVAPFAIVLAILTPFIGEVENGAIRAIKVFGISLQAAEPCKFASALLLAYIFARFQKKEGGLSMKGIWWGVAVMFMFAALLITQGGSNTLLVLMVSVLMMIIGGLPRKLLIAGGVVCVIGIGAIIGVHYSKSGDDKSGAHQVESVAKKENVKKDSDSFLTAVFQRMPTWKRRIDSWLGDGKPEYDKTTDYGVGGNSQKHHACMAIAHGNGIGVMPGNSRECSRLQLAFSDFIYAIILEELGLFGGIVVLLCYLGIVIRAGMIGSKCKNAYSTLLIMGMALMIALQAFYHMSISVGLLPVSGQTLPFISKGGTSIVIMSMAMGVMLSVSRYAVERTSEGLKTIDEDDELPQDLRANNPTGIM